MKNFRNSMKRLKINHTSSGFQSHPRELRGGSDGDGAGCGDGDGFEMGRNNHTEQEKKTENELKRGTTWPATQVGLRTVKSGLGGHDDGASGDDEGSKSNRYRYRNGDEGVSDSATFSGFVGADNHFVSENQSCLNETKS